MNTTLQIPDAISQYLAGAGVSSRKTGPLKAVAQSDIDVNGVFAECWIVAGTRSLVVVDLSSGTHALYPYKTLEDVKIENMVSTGVLSAKVDGGETLLMRFTNSRAKEMGHFVQIA